MRICFNGKPVTAGDHGTVVVIFNNLTGANFEDKASWSEYVAWMNTEFYAEAPLKAGMRVDLVCHGLTYASFVFGKDQISGVGQDDIAKVYQMNQPCRITEQRAARRIYKEVCTWSGQELRCNPFCPTTDFERFKGFALARYRALTGTDFLQVLKLRAAAQSEQERAFYTSICEASPWYGDECIGARLKEDLFREPSPF